MTKPNFMIIGSAKSGSTALYHYLKQHPQVFMSPIKETNFFSFAGKDINFRWWGSPPRAILSSITDYDTYCAQFEGVSDEIAVGEASPLYLYDPEAAIRIQEYLPDVKLIAILRNPIDRAYSHYLHLVRDNREPCDTFCEALNLEERRKLENWTWDYYYKDLGFYFVQLRRFYKRFHASQMLVLLYEDLLADEVGFVQEIFRFLKVDDSFVPDTTTRYNVSGVPINRNVQMFLQNPSNAKKIIKYFLPQSIRRSIRSGILARNLKKPSLPDDIHRVLAECYREDIQALQTLLHRDLSHWLTILLD